LLGSMSLLCAVSEEDRNFLQPLINLISTLFDLNCYKWNYKWKRPENSIP
jgi:hypothetical protein